MGWGYSWRKCFHRGAWALDTTLNSLIHEAACLPSLSGMWFSFTGMAGIFCCRNPLEAWGERGYPGQVTSPFPTSHTRERDPLTGASDWLAVCVRVKSLQSCPTLCNLMDCSLPGSAVHGILQAKVLEWVAMPSSRGSSPPRDQTHVSCVSFIGRWVLDH